MYSMLTHVECNNYVSEYHYLVGACIRSASKEGPSAARRSPSAIGRAWFLGPALYSGCPQRITPSHADGPTTSCVVTPGSVP